MSGSSGKIRVSTFQRSCGLSSSAVLGVWEEARPNATLLLSSSPQAPSSMPQSMHQEGDCYLQNAVLLRHCKSGALHNAVSFFDKMAKDLYSWNIMMSMYNRLRDGGGKVLALLNQMQQEATIPNTFILANIISACTTYGDVRPGKIIHACISQAQGLCLDVVLQSALINMYGRFGELKVACQLFSDNPLPDTALWNGMLTICSQNGIDMDCLILYNHMQQLCIMQNNITYVLMLSVCSKVTSLSEGKKLHTRIVAVGCETDIMVGTALINMYNKCGQVDNANDIFGRMQERDIILWNAVIAGYSLNMKHKEVYQLYAQMEQEGAMPNEATYTSILDACTSSSEGKQVHACIIGRSFGLDVVADAALLKMYSKCGGGADEAHRYFKEMKHHDIVAWNTMISTFAKEGMNMQALQLYGEMMKEGMVPDGVTFVTILSTFMSEAEYEEGKLVHRHIVYLGLDLETGVTNALINMYGKCSSSLHDAMAIFNKLRNRDIVTFVNMISACSSQAIFAQGQYIHTLIKEEKIESNTILANAIMSMYSKSGYLSDARKVFEEMQEQKTVVSWSTIIATYGQHGEGKEVLYLYDQMQRSGIELEPITLVSLIFAFSQAGLLDEGCHSFSFIVGKQQLVTLDYFTCMIDLLGRVGCLDDAMCLISGMPFQPSNMSWSILVCASQLHMHFDRGELASEYVLELNPDDTTGYVVLSNIYNAQCLDIL